MPTALVAAAIGAVVIELIRARSRTAGDLALALIFYGGIAGGVFFTSLAGGKSSTALNQYLFGSLSTVAATDLVWLGRRRCSSCSSCSCVFGREIFVMALDPDVARTQGIRTTAMSMLLTVLAAFTVVIGMRTVGLLLVSAIMIVPIAAAQQLTRGFRTTALVGVVVGRDLRACSAWSRPSSSTCRPGPAIVFLALGLFARLRAGRPCRCDAAGRGRAGGAGARSPTPGVGG